MKRIFKILTVLSMFIFVLACGGNKEKVIIMGTNAEFPPFEYRDSNQITGFDIELANAIAKDMGAKLEIKDMGFDGLIPALQSKKIDFIASGMSVTEERKKNVNFSTGYYKASQVIIVNKDNTEITKPEDLKGKKIGVQIGTTGDMEAEKIENVDLKKYNAAFAAVLELKNKKIDAIVLDYEPAYNFTKQNQEIKLLNVELTQEEYAMAVRKEDKDLLESINKTLNTLKSNGEYDKLVKKYFDK